MAFNNAKSAPKPKRRASSSPGNGGGDVWPTQLLSGISAGKTRVTLRKGDTLYSQGDAADSVFFVESGKVRLSVLSKAGRSAVLGNLTAGEFCGEGCLSGQIHRIGTATATTATEVVRVRKAELIDALHRQHPLSEAFLARLLARNIAFEEDICDQLFNHSEKRLARILIKLSRVGLDPVNPAGRVIQPRISQETLAEMVGTTRSRVNLFMNKFRRLGLIDYNGDVRVHPELLTDIVLSD
jgi:CRP-like cAMP-binding protein